MKTLVVLHHRKAREEVVKASVVCAQLRNLLDTREYAIWRPDMQDWTSGEQAQLLERLAAAEGVIVILGPEGLDESFWNLEGEKIEQLIARNPKYGRLLVLLPGVTEAPQYFHGWVTEKVDEPDIEFKAIADTILKRLGVEPAWSDKLHLERAVLSLAESGRNLLRPHLEKVAQALSAGKPITFFIGPYASMADEPDDVPSRVRAALVDLIDDDAVREGIRLSGEARATALWQDYLATLCLLSGKGKDEVGDTINDLIGALPGDMNHGEAPPVFNSLARLITRLQETRGTGKRSETPVTIISVCPGLRIERALVAEGHAFERVTFPFRDGRASREVQQYTPAPQHVARAKTERPEFMPEPEDPAADQPPFIRLLKIAGSLDRSPPAGDLAQMFELVSMQTDIADYVKPAERGPYIMLGGGLATPPVRAAHAVLLRNALRGPETRSQLALIPRPREQADPWLLTERGHESALSKIGHHDRLRVLSASPTEFVDALSIAFGGVGARG